MRWVKMWTKECLMGTIRFDFTPAERSVWYDLILLAGQCGRGGVIGAGPGVPFPHSFIAGQLNIPPKLLEEVLRKCGKTDRIYENGDGINIKNWSKYQSEYDRQKGYRQAKKLDDDPDKYIKGEYGHMVRRKGKDDR